MKDISTLINIDAATANLDLGEMRDDATPGDGTGTEIVKSYIQDMYYALRAVMEKAGIDPDDSEEGVVASQFADAVINLSKYRDTIDEATVDAGVTVEGVLLRDSGIDIPGGGELKHNAITTNGYITEGVADFPADSVIRLKVLVIGDWNMDTTDYVNVEHGLSDWSKVINFWAIIRNDVGSKSNLIVSSVGATSGKSLIDLSGVYCALYREEGGFYDNTNYDATSYSRGWVFIQYID